MGNLLNGKGTYIVGAAVIMYGLLGLVFGSVIPGIVEVTPNEALGVLTTGMLILTGRRAIGKLGQ